MKDYTPEERPGFIWKEIFENAAEMQANATQATKAAHLHLLNFAESWDDDQRWAIAELIADAVLETQNSNPPIIYL